MTDFVMLSREALRYLDRDGLAKHSLGEPYTSDREILSQKSTGHCVGGLVNMALSGGYTEWLHTDEGYATYDRVARFMREQWPTYDQSITVYRTEKHFLDMNSIADINNNPAFTESDARKVLTAIATFQ